MKLKIAAIVLVLCSLLMAFSKEINTSFFNAPKSWPTPVYNFKNNPLTLEKIELGRALFYDPILSKDSTISCAGCHSQYNAFAHVDHALSHGINDQIGNRNAPALMNLAWSTHFMWDGAINHLDLQALAPISHPLEMNETLLHVTQKLQRNPLYVALYKKAFGDAAVTGERTLKALSQFMLTLVSAQSKYDSVMRGEQQFTTQEQKGYTLFKNHCAVCHAEPLFTNKQFENNGLPTDPELMDIGRMKISQAKADSLKFKVPTLRNIEFTFPYMHDGRFKYLKDVLNHYSSGIAATPTLSVHLKNGLGFTPTEKVDIIAFLLTLTDKSFLFDERYSYPKHIFKP
jgi:cytochrome c peroxidase